MRRAKPKLRHKLEKRVGVAWGARFGGDRELGVWVPASAADDPGLRVDSAIKM